MSFENQIFQHLLQTYYEPYRLVYGIVGLIFMILFTAFAQFFYKLYSIHKKKKFIFIALFLFASTPICGYLALLVMSIDIVSICSALILVIVTIMSHFYLHENFSRNEIIGILLIILGIIGYCI